MKKVLSVLLAIIIVFSLCSCGQGSSGNGFTSNNNQELLTSDSSSTSKNNQESLNAQNLIARLKGSDGFVYYLGYDGDPFALYFGDESSRVKGVRLSDRDTLSIDYDRLASEPECYFEVYNDSHFSISQDWGDSYSFELVYSDPENRFVVFADDDYEAGDDFNLFSDAFTFMSKETMKSFFKGATALYGILDGAISIFYPEMREELYPSTVEGSVKLINDCIDAAN